MEDQNILLELINQYPWLLYGLLVLIVILAFYAIIQGREFSLFGIKLGGKIKDQSVSQSQTVQVFSTALTQEQMDELVKRFAESVETIRQEAGNQTPNVLYQPPDLPDRLEYIYSARHEIERKVRTLVLSHGGAWAGSSMAPFDVYLDYAVSGKVISPELGQKITDFYIMFTQPMINFGEVSDESFLDIQYLAVDINLKLDEI